MVAPSTQKAAFRPIGFVLENQITGQVTSQLDLVIRPEELTRPSPSRLTATQTFGGAWVDNFGPGLSSINISGHTGWRGGAFADGAALFQQLKSTVFDQWHAMRAAAVSAGQDPAGVQLIFADTLDQVVNVVVPTNFTLRRSRTRPLLMMYQISMIVVSEQVDATAQAAAQSLESLASTAYASLGTSINTLNGYVSSLPNIVDVSLVQPFGSFISLATGSFSSVMDAIATGTGVIESSVLSAATDLAKVGETAMHCYLAVADLADAAAIQVMDIASCFGNVLCLLNAFRVYPQYPDYSDLYGASYCSSTNGGDPISPLIGLNPIALAMPMASASIEIGAAARAGISLLANTDPVLAPLPVAQIGFQLGSISAGITL